MKNNDSLRTRTVVAASSFATEWKLDHPPYGAVLKRLHAAAERLPALAKEQSDAHSAWIGNSHMADLLRNELRRKHLIKYARLGKKLFAGQPEAENAFRVPGARASAATLASFSDAMVKVIEKDLQGFLEQEAPPDFIERLQDVVRNLNARQRGIAESIARQKAATAALAKEIPSAREDVKILEGLLEDRLREGGIFATKWLALTRVGKRKGQPRHGKWNWSTSKPTKKKRRK